MPKYINAKDLLNEVFAETVEGRIFDGNTYVGTFNVVPIGDITEIVNHMPSADVVEAKYGYWKPLNNDPVNHPMTVLCSECRYISYKRTDFCPHCGANMKGWAEQI